MSERCRFGWLLGSVLLAGCAVTAKGGGDEATVVLGDFEFLPSEGSPVLPPELALGEPASAGVGYYVLQFDGPVTDAKQAAVRSVGVELFDYVPHGAFLARMDPEAREAAAELDSVRWIGVYEPAFRLSATLYRRVIGTAEARPPRPAFGEVGTTRKPRPPVEGLQVRVRAFPGVEAKSLERAITRGGSRVVDGAERGGVARFLVQTELERVAELARIPGVHRIEEYVQPGPWNDVGRGILNVDDVWASVGLRGAGQIVGVVDSGLDSGAIGASMHPDIQGRVLGLLSYPVRPGYLNAGADDGMVDLTVGHGTHVTGSVLGDGNASAGVYAGVATEALVLALGVEQFTTFPTSNYDSYLWSGIPFDIYPLFDIAHNAGARIHSNSWGWSAYGEYDDLAEALDQAVWDHPELFVLVAAGNDGEDADADDVIDLGSLGSPATAKNCLTVGASENFRPALDHFGPSTAGPTIAADRIADDPNGMAYFSSRGPANSDTTTTADDRIKPDLVAPGTLVASTKSRFSPDVPYYQDDMEGGVAGWTTTGTWAQSTADSVSPVTSWHDSPGGNYAELTLNDLTSPPIDLSADLQHKLLLFRLKADLGTGDQWSVVIQEGTSSESFMGLGDTGGEWRSYSLWLGPHASGNYSRATDFQVTFRLFSDDDGSTGDGISIDDVAIVGQNFFDKLGIEGLAPPGSLEDQSYRLASGTSMACPLTAGAAAIARQYYTETLGISWVSGALLRATLINGATDMSPGQYGVGPNQEIPLRPNNVEGWGRVDLEQSLFPDPPALLDHVDEVAGLTTGEVREYTLDVLSTGVPIVVTMVYHDYPGAALVNDLDLALVSPSGTIHWPNGLAGLDSRNNVEQIFVPTPEAGVHILRVTGANVPFGPQPYAVVSTFGGEIQDRPPVDVALVLDFSGSMNSPACAVGCVPKRQVLKDAVEIFLQLWEKLAVPDDRISVTFFRANVEPVEIAGDTLVNVLPNVQTLIAAVQGKNAGASTAMGSGLQHAINDLDDPTRPRSIVLFTDGMQNKSPMVTDVGGQLEIADDPAKNDSNVPPTVPPTVLDTVLGIKVNTIGVGASPAFETLLADFSAGTAGLTKITTAPDDDLIQFFVEELVDVLRDYSPQLVDYRRGALELPGVTAETFQVNTGPKQILFELSWERGKDVNFTLEHDGMPLPAGLGEVVEGEFYKIVSLYPPYLVGEEVVSAQGQWTMRIQSEDRVTYEAAVIVDEPILDFDVVAGPATLEVGEDLRLEARVLVDGEPLDDARVLVTLRHPRVGVGTLLADTKGFPTPDFEPSEEGLSPGQHRLQALLTESVEFQAAIEKQESGLFLQAVGGGRYTATFGKTLAPGSYTANFVVEGNHPTLGTFRREETVSCNVSFGDTEPAKSEIQVQAAGASGGWRFHVTPRDGFGNALGPDYGQAIELVVPKGKVGDVQDRGDGRYVIPFSTAGDPTIELRILGRSVLREKLSKLAKP